MVLRQGCLNDKDADFLGGPVVNNLPDNAKHKGSIPGPGRFHMLSKN